MARTHEEHWFREFVQHFSQNTSIHGMRFLGLKNISRLERIFWLVIIIAALAYSYELIRSNAKHFIANPTVVSIKKDFRNWENPFPAVTACFVNKLDPEKAQNFVLRKWGILENDANYDYYMDFVKTVTNLTYRTFYTLTKFQNDSTLNNIDMVELITEVHPALTGVLVTFQTKVKTEWQFVLTELGICFSLNSGFAELLSPSYSGSDNLMLGSAKENLKCHYLNGLCYARYDTDPNMPIEYHVHSYLDVIHATSERPIQVGVSEEVEINYRITETYSSQEIRYLAPNQRKCRFQDEPYTNNVPVYSTSICYVECRSKWALSVCGCKPFFYKFLDGKVCDINGLLCLKNKFSIFYETFHCKCPQPCNLIAYLKQVPKIMKWDAGYFDQRNTFRWGLVPPTTKYHRKILFGFRDLFVSLGAVLSVFLGMSFVSFQETIYLCCTYLWTRFQKRKKRRNMIRLKEADRRVP